MIEISQLRKGFAGVTAVRDVSFTAPDGRITGLLGENGAGKTTTLALTCGLLLPDAGSIRVGPDSCTPLERRLRVGGLLDHKGLYGREGQTAICPRCGIDAVIGDNLASTCPTTFWPE